MSCSIYVITHKEVDLDLPNGYYKLLVGAAGKQELKGDYLLDSQGPDDISHKNKNYCELTGLHWIWKNDGSDIKGLVHYRRYFTGNRFTGSSSFYFTAPKIQKLLSKADVIVAEKLYIDEKTVKEDYLAHHKAEDWYKLKQLIAEVYPDYLTAFETIENGNWFYPYNMIICKTQEFNAYCEWIFGVLGRMEDLVDLSGYDTQQARIYGFLSERLLAVWLLTNHCRVYEAPVIQTDCRFRYRIRRALEKVCGKKVVLRGE